MKRRRRAPDSTRSLAAAHAAVRSAARSQALTADAIQACAEALKACAEAQEIRKGLSKSQDAVGFQVEQEEDDEEEE